MRHSTPVLILLTFAALIVDLLDVAVVLFVFSVLSAAGDLLAAEREWRARHNHPAGKGLR